MNIVFNKEAKEVEALDGNKKIGYLQFEEDGSIWKATHTVVEKKYGGRGIAGDLLDKFVEEARDKNKKIYPICSYVVKKFDEDDKYKDVDAR